MNTLRYAFAFLCFVGLAAPRPASASQDAPKPATQPSDLSGLHAFDLRNGHWLVHHRRLKERLMGSHEWIEFDGSQNEWPLMNGYSNVDENTFKMPGGEFKGVTLRAYDSRTGEWSIWWLDGREPGQVDTPVKGRFENGVGIFYSDDTLRGKPVRVRFAWSNITAEGAHWEQAFSADGGKTWETNWTSDFRKAQ